MGFNEGTIVMDSPTGAYYSGQFVNGRVEFELTKVKKVRAIVRTTAYSCIFLKVKGFCKVHWTTEHTRRNNDRTEHYTVTHESYEEYLNIKTYLIGSKNEELHLNPGKYVYPFSFEMPETSPSSYESSNGHIRYELKVVADIPFSIDQELNHPLRVIVPVDLNKLNCREPVDFEFDQTYCCWCMNAGSSETLVKMPVTGYCPGQVIPLEVSCKNPSSVEIDFIKFVITKEVTYRAVSAADTRHDSEQILAVSKGPVAGHTDRNWLVELQVPDMDVYNMDNCSFIDIQYTFKVTVEPEGCHSSSDDSCNIKFGTIPLVGIQDNVSNPLQDQLPTTLNLQNYPNVYPPPIINQPLLQNAYPGVASPYPAANQQFPGRTSPYPNPSVPSPYPGSNPPYPSVNSPFPPNPYPATPVQGTSPYPATPVQGTSPYPATPVQGTSPYPATPVQGTSPYPATPVQGTSPYPATPVQGTSPYPATPVQGTSPYPATPVQGTSPYPATPVQGTSPYPATPVQGTSPYPATPVQGTSPYPSTPVQGTSPYPNGYGSPPPHISPASGAPRVTSPPPSLGLTPVPMPSLPQGAALPYPPKVPSPYATASAPVPSTPDSEQKNLLDDNANKSPYNPDFINHDKNN